MIRKIDSGRPPNPSPLFEGIPKLYLPQTLDLLSFKFQKRQTDCGSRSWTSKKQKVDKNVIKSGTILNSSVRISNLMQMSRYFYFFL